MSKSRNRPEIDGKPPSKKRRIRQLLQRQLSEREMMFFPERDPPQFKPLG